MLNFKSTLSLQAPSDAPQKIDIRNTTSGNQFNITWESPATPNGVIVNYQVNITDTVTGEIDSKDTGNRTFLISIVLKHYHHYNISILAATSVGNGPPSDPMTKLTDEGRKC